MLMKEFYSPLNISPFFLLPVQGTNATQVRIKLPHQRIKFR